MNNLHQLFIDLLRDLYDTENQIVLSLPKLIKEASDQELKKALSEHLDKTYMHIKRLEQIGMDLDVELGGQEGRAIRVLLEEGNKNVKSARGSDVKDAALIGGAQKIEHFEIAGYGTAASWAKTMGHEDALEILVETLNEEKDADEKLTKIAKGTLFTTGVNGEAMNNRFQSV